MKKQWSLVCLLVLVGVACLGSVTQAGQTANAEQAFAKMKSLVGRWEATTADGKKAVSNFELVSDNSALLERFWVEGSGEKENMITVYHLDRGNLMLTHYCSAKNQPRMRAEPFSAETKTLKFTFLDATNLLRPDDGHMYCAVYKFSDADHFTTEWTFRKDQKDAFTEVLHFTRMR